MSADVQPKLRLRRRKSKEDNEPLSDGMAENVARKEDVVWGKTPGGEGKVIHPTLSTLYSRFILASVFRVPTTHDVLTLFHPSYPKSHIDLLNLALLGLQLVLFCLLPRSTAQKFFFIYFAFWRAAYDVGLGWVLTKQSKKKWIVKEVQRLGWLDEQRKPEVRAWIRRQLAGKMGKDYSFDVRPIHIHAMRRYLLIWSL